MGTGRNNLDQFNPQAVSEGDIYHFLISHWQHHNELSWSKLNVILALETATLAGSFSIKEELLKCSLLVIGTIVGLIIYKLMRRDWHVRDYHLPLLDKIHQHIANEVTNNNEIRPIRMIPPAKSSIENGQILLLSLMTILFLTNYSVFLYVIFMIK